MTQLVDPSASTRGVLAVLGGGVVDPATPLVLADDPGVTRGDGCFEGIRVVAHEAGARADNLDRHLARFARSAAALGIAFDEPAWRALVATACAGWTEPADGAMKLVLTRGVDRPTGWARIVPADPDYARQRREGLRVVTVSRGVAEDAFAAAPWLLGGVKTLSYAINMAAQREAQARGADEAVFLAADGTVLEAPTASVVWAVGRTLHTTTLEGTGVLAGTTQDRLFAAAGAAGWTPAYTRTDLAGLRAADAVWLVSAIRGPVEVAELDGHSCPRDPDLAAEIRALAGF